MFGNLYMILSGINTWDPHKHAIVEGTEICEGFRVFSESIGIMQGFHIDLGNDEDRILMTIAGDRIMIVHASIQFCLSLVHEFGIGNVVTVTNYNSLGHSLWVAEYDKELFERVITYMASHPHVKQTKAIADEEATTTEEVVANEGSAVIHGVTSEHGSVNNDAQNYVIPPVEGVLKDDVNVGYLAPLDEEYDHDVEPSLWWRIREWFCRIFRLYDYEDDENLGCDDEGDDYRPRRCGR